MASGDWVHTRSISDYWRYGRGLGPSALLWGWGTLNQQPVPNIILSRPINIAFVDCLQGGAIREWGGRIRDKWVSLPGPLTGVAIGKFYFYLQMKESNIVISILGHSKSISCFSSPDFYKLVNLFPSAPAQYKSSIFWPAEFMVLTTISYQTCDARISFWAQEAEDEKQIWSGLLGYCTYMYL